MQFNNPAFKPIEQSSVTSQSSFRTEFVPTQRITQRSDHQYDKIFSSETDLSSRINDSLLNEPLTRPFDMVDSRYRRTEPEVSRALSLTYTLDHNKPNNYVRFGEDDQDTSLLHMVNILQKSNYNVERISLGMQQLDTLFNRIADISDTSSIPTKKQLSLTQAEINKHMTMTIGEEELRDELRDQVYELPHHQLFLKNKENATTTTTEPTKVPTNTLMRSHSQPFVQPPSLQENRFQSAYEQKPTEIKTAPIYTPSANQYSRMDENFSEPRKPFLNIQKPTMESGVPIKQEFYSNQPSIDPSWNKYDSNRRFSMIEQRPVVAPTSNPWHNPKTQTDTAFDLPRNLHSGQMVKPFNFDPEPGLPTYVPEIKQISRKSDEQIRFQSHITERTSSYNEVKSPNDSSFIQSKRSNPKEDQAQFSYSSIPRYSNSKNSQNHTTNQFEVLNISTPIMEAPDKHSPFLSLKHSYADMNEPKSRQNKTDTYHSQMVTQPSVFEGAPKQHEIFKPHIEPRQSSTHYKMHTQQNYYQPPPTPTTIANSPQLSKHSDEANRKIFDSQQELFEKATQNVYQQRYRSRQQKAPKWEKKKAQPDLNVLCINCDELISISSVDQHSKLCLAKTKPLKIGSDSEIISELISELNRKIGVVRTTIQKSIGSLRNQDRMALIELLDRIIEENTNYQSINEVLEPLNRALNTYSLRTDKDSLYLTLLIQRCILLSEEKALKIQFIKQQVSAPIDDSTLFGELSVVERQAQQERANLELWKQQHEMMVMVQVQDLANMKYLKREYLGSENEVLSQIRSDWDRRTSENRSQQPPGGTSQLSDLHYQNDIDQVYNGPIDRNSLNNSAPELEGKRIFYHMAVQAKLNLPYNHKGKNILIQDIYVKAIEKKLPQEQWMQFIKKEIDNFRS